MRALVLLLLLALPAAAQELPRRGRWRWSRSRRCGSATSSRVPGRAPRQPIGAAPAPGRRLVLEARAARRPRARAWPRLAAALGAGAGGGGTPGPRRCRGRRSPPRCGPSCCALGLDPEAELDLGPLRAAHGAARRARGTGDAEGASFDPPRGRFAATLVVMADGMPTLRLRLAGPRAADPAGGGGDAPAGARRRDRRRRPARWCGCAPSGCGRARRSALDQVSAGSCARPIGGEHALQRGRPRRARAGRPKNTLVTMVLEAPGLSLTAQGRALEAAPRGGRCR